MDQAKTFEWLRQRSQRLDKVEAELVKAQLEIARLKVKPIVDREKEGERVGDLMQMRLGVSLVDGEGGDKSPRAGACIGRFDGITDECTKCGLTKADHEPRATSVTTDAAAEVQAILDSLGNGYIRVREEGGPEDIYASLAVSVARLQRRSVDAAAVKRALIRHVEEMNAGFTVEMDTGRLVPDADGPWFLKSSIIKSLSSVEVATEEKGKPMESEEAK